MIKLKWTSPFHHSDVKILVTTFSKQLNCIILAPRYLYRKSLLRIQCKLLSLNTVVLNNACDDVTRTDSNTSFTAPVTQRNATSWRHKQWRHTATQAYHADSWASQRSAARRIRRHPLRSQPPHGRDKLDPPARKHTWHMRMHQWRCFTSPVL